MKRMIHNARSFLAIAALATASALGLGCAGPTAGDNDLPQEEPQVVQTPVSALPALPALQWRLPPKYATLDGTRLVIDIPADAYPADAVAEAELPAALFAGAKGFSLTVEARGAAIAKPNKSWLGLKFQMHWMEAATGREGYPNCPAILGDFDRRELRNEATFGGAAPDTVTLMLGLQGTTGRVEFDLSTLRGAPGDGLFRRINQDWRVRYPAATEGADGASRRSLRGFMLSQREPTEDDFATLASWGATLVRYQICRNWSKNNDNADLAEFNQWLDGKLDVLERIVLPNARKHGMKVVVDLHVTPGGRNEAREMNMFYNKEYADEFVAIWRRIATRFKGNDDALYGYDLVNEPKQLERAPFDYWTLQRLAAEAVREIDPVTPIIIESNGMDAPSTFEYLSPLRMDNVIYQVHCYAPTAFTHQGVHGTPTGPVWPDPAQKWDRDFIRATLRPVREFEQRHNAKIYVGEFSAIAWADGAENYLRDCMAVFEDYGWDWTYHAFREWSGWSLEHTCDGPGKPFVPAADNPRKRALLDGLKGNR